MSSSKPTHEELIAILGKPFNDLSSTERGHKLDMLFNQVTQMGNGLQQMRKQMIDSNTMLGCEIKVLKNMLGEEQQASFPAMLEIQIDASRGLRKANAEEVVENKDWVRVSYVGTNDAGEIVKGTQGQSEIYIGAKQFIEDFEAAVLGMKCGEIKDDVACTFPADYPAKDFAGMVIKFHIEIVAHKKPLTPVLPQG